MKLPTNAHKRSRRFFENGVARSEVETIILLCLNAHPGAWCEVRDFVILASFLDSAADENQLSYVARRMAETGELMRRTRGANYQYLWWADEPNVPCGCDDKDGVKA